MLHAPMDRSPKSQREHLRRLVAGKQEWSEPLSDLARAKGFKGWHERGYLPHCDKPGLTQFITFRLWDSLPASRRGEWEHLLAVAERSDAPRAGPAGDASATGARSIASPEPKQGMEQLATAERGDAPRTGPAGDASVTGARSIASPEREQGMEQRATAEGRDAPRTGPAGDASDTGARSIASPEPEQGMEQRATAARAQRIALENYLDRGLGECFLRDPRIATLLETTLRFHHGWRFDLLAWVVMPNHVHALIRVGDNTPLFRIIQNWKSLSAVAANKLLERSGDFWRVDYWDTFMRDAGQTRNAIRYIEINPVKAKLCRAPEEWPFSSARFRDPQTRELKLPP